MASIEVLILIDLILVILPAKVFEEAIVRLGQPLFSETSWLESLLGPASSASSGRHIMSR